MEQSSSSAKLFFILPKPDVPVLILPDLQTLPLPFEYLIGLLDLDQYI
jgi:hypothetical protein